MDGHPAPSPDHSIERHLGAIESLLKEVIEKGEFDLRFTIRAPDTAQKELEATEYVVEFSGPDADLLLAGGASLLNALEYLILKAVRLEEDLFGRVTFDCQDWRLTRAQELKLMAQVAAERVVETGDSFALSPMNPRERRIVHLALKDRTQVRTVSEGVGPERKVVILPVSSPPRSGKA